MGADGTSQSLSTTTPSTPMHLDTEMQAHNIAHAPTKAQQHRQGDSMKAAILPTVAVVSGIAGLIMKAPMPWATSGPHVAAEGPPETALPEWFFYVTLVASGIGGGGYFKAPQIGKLLVYGVTIITHAGAFGAQFQGCQYVLGLDVLPDLNEDGGWNPNPPIEEDSKQMVTMIGFMMMIQFFAKFIMGYFFMHQETNEGGAEKLFGLIPGPVVADVFVGPDLLFVQLCWLKDTPNALDDNPMYNFAAATVMLKMVAVLLLACAFGYSHSQDRGEQDLAAQALLGAKAAFALVCVGCVAIYVLGLNPLADYSSIFSTIGWCEMIEDGIFLMIVKQVAAGGGGGDD